MMTDDNLVPERSVPGIGRQHVFLELVRKENAY